MVDLAVSADSAPISAREIVARQGISKKYLEQILATLQSAGLVISVRGRDGGYQLARSPQDITVRDVYEAIEPGGGLVPCTSQQTHEMSAECVLADVWQGMFDAMMQVLEGNTLADLAERLCPDQAISYTI